MNKYPDFLDFTHMRRAESEIIQAQLTILRALKELIPRAADSDIIDEIQHSMRELTEFYYEGKHDDDGDDAIQYADIKIELKTG